MFRRCQHYTGAKYLTGASQCRVNQNPSVGANIKQTLVLFRRAAVLAVPTPALAQLSERDSNAGNKMPTAILVTGVRCLGHVKI